MLSLFDYDDDVVCLCRFFPDKAEALAFDIIKVLVEVSSFCYDMN